MALRPFCLILMCTIISGCAKPVEDTSLAKGKAAFRTGEFDKAIELLTKAIEENPLDAAGYLYRGQAYITKGSEYASQAISDYSEAIRLNPEDCEGYYNRAIAYRKKGEPAKALQDDMMARRFDPAAQRTGRMYSTTPEEYRLAIERAAAKDPHATPEEMAKSIEDEASGVEYLPEKVVLPESLSKRMSPDHVPGTVKQTDVGLGGVPTPSASSPTPSLGLPSRQPDKAFGASPPAEMPREESLTEKLFGENASKETGNEGRTESRRPDVAAPTGPRSPVGVSPSPQWNTGPQPAAPLSENASPQPPARRSPVGTLPFGHPYQARTPGASYSPYAPINPYGASPQSPLGSSNRPYAPYSPYGGGGARSTGIQSRSALPQGYNPYGGGALPTPRLPYGP